MKRFACRDMGMNCNYQVSGENEDEIVRKAAEHGQKAHNKMLTPDDEKKVRQQIKSA